MPATRTDVRRGQLELLQVRAAQARRFYARRIVVFGPVAEVGELARWTGSLSRWDRVLLATCRLLGDRSDLEETPEPAVSHGYSV